MSGLAISGLAISARTIHPACLGLLGLAGLAALAAGLWPVDASAPLAPPGPPPLDLAALAAAETGAAVAAPLFDPERRPWTARGSRADLTAEASPPTMLSVRGILIEAGARRALVADGTGAPAWLAPGEGQGAWRLVSVEPEAVVVADAGRRYTLAYLGAPVALRPPPRHPGPDVPGLRPSLGPGEAPPRPEAAPVPPRAAAPVRRIAIDPSGR
jgi:hypothetical protein